MAVKKAKYINGILLLLIFGLVVKCRDNPSQTKAEWQNVKGAELQYRILTDKLMVPWQTAFTDDGRIFITERGGLVRVLKNGQLLERPWLDLRDSLETSEGSTVRNSGLQGIALDPEFEKNGLVYLGYAYEAPGKEYAFNKLVQYKEYPNTGDVRYQKTLLDSVKGESLHNSGQIKIGPDKKIYWSIGDRWQPESAQDPEDLSGSILRLNTDGSIPENNPFPDSYVYSYGHRDAQGFDWHPDSGIMLATEHGPYGRDEINIIEQGKNYGWPKIRGDESKEGMKTPLIHSGYGKPLEEFTWAPSGATFVDSGPWKGTFLFAGLRSESLWQLVLDENNKVKKLNRFLQNKFRRLRSVEQGLNGNIFIITSNLDRNKLPIGKDFLIELEVGVN